MKKIVLIVCVLLISVGCSTQSAQKEHKNNRPDEENSEMLNIDIKNLVAEPSESVEKFIEAITKGNHDSLALTYVVNRSEYESLLPKSKNSQTAQNSSLIANMLAVSTQKHYERWQNEIRKNELEFISLAIGDTVHENGYDILTNCTVLVRDRHSATVRMNGIHSFLKYNGHYKIWSIKDI